MRYLPNWDRSTRCEATLWPLQPGGIEFWPLPRANHYLQLDQPKEFVEVISAALAGNILEAPRTALRGPGRPLLVDSFRTELLSAKETLAGLGT